MPMMARGSESLRRRRSIGSNSDDTMIQMPSTMPIGVSQLAGAVDAVTPRTRPINSATPKPDQDAPATVAELPALPGGMNADGHQRHRAAA